MAVFSLRCLRCCLVPLGISLGLGAIFWVADAVYGYLAFSERVRFLLFEQPLTLWDSLFYRIPPHDLYIRLAFLVMCILAALLVGAFVVRRRQAEDRLERVNSIIENSPVVAFEWAGNEDAPVAFVTKNVSSLLGYTAREFLSQQVDVQQIIHPADLAEVRDEIRAAVEDPRTTAYSLSQHRLYTKTGDMRWVDVRGVIRRDSEGTVLRRDEIVIDVTEQRLLEQRLQEQQKFESLGILSAGVAHEINNPLTGVINYAELILTLSSHEKIKEYCGDIISEGQRIARIVSSLLTYARRDVDDRGFVNVADLIDDALNLVGSTLRKDQIQIAVEIKDDLPQILGSHQQIEQILINLLMNSRDALNLRFEGYDEEKKLRLAGSILENTSGNFVRITVEDRGAGVSPEIMTQIFDPFFTTKSRTEGTGLGLAISRSIARAHHGDLTVDRVGQQHTRFHLDLPVP